MITGDDLRWWLDHSRTLKFKEAVTYREVAPHSYVIRHKQIKDRDFQRALRVIHSFGEVQQYHGKPNLYLVDKSRNVKWWTMGMGLPDHRKVLNQAPADQYFGRQPLQGITSTGKITHGDCISSFYETELPREDETPILRSLVRENFGAYAPSLVDIGAGTGQVLDSKITSPAITTVVDESRGMLNQLIMKHRNVKEIIPSPLADADVRPKELMTAMGGSASYLSREELAKAFKLGLSSAIFSAFTAAPEWSGLSSEKVKDTLEFLEHQRSRLNCRVIRTNSTSIYAFRRGS